MPICLEWKNLEITRTWKSFVFICYLFVLKTRFLSAAPGGLELEIFMFQSLQSLDNEPVLTQPVACTFKNPNMW